MDYGKSGSVAASAPRHVQAALVRKASAERELADAEAELERLQKRTK